MEVLFAHGFEGKPNGSKPTFMKENLGWNVTAPVMSSLGWGISDQTKVLTDEMEKTSFDLIIGSSMGGLAVANASAIKENHDCKLILIAPAFGLYDNLLERLTEEELELWERLDRRRYVGFEHDILLPWSYMEQAKDMSWTVPHHKTIIIHGISDDIVPIQSSRKISQMSDLIDLHEIEDNHRMKKSLQVLEEVVSTLMSS
jgi:pimeloyl-ACP methyl ester carboxylesterase